MLNVAKALGVTTLGLVALLSSTTPTLALSSGAHHNIHHARSHNDQAKRFIAKSQGGKVIRRADGSVCKVRPTTSAAAVSVTASATDSVTSSSTTIAYAAATSSVTAAQEVVTSATADGSAETSSSSSSAAPAASSVAATVAVSAVASSDSTGTNAGSPFGLAWPNGDWASSSDPNYVGNYIGSKSSWYYTWSPYNVGSADTHGLEFVPMLWGPNQEGVWWDQVASWPSSVKNVLFFNEPNEASQCNMAAADSVAHWLEYMQPLAAKGYKLGMAATTSAPSGLQWVKDFIAACPQCTVDFVPIHWYDVSASNFQTYVENFHAQTGLDIWVTEYACQNFNGGAQCSDSETWALHQTMAPWFDAQSYVKRYSPFGVMTNLQGVNTDNALMGSDGAITALGSWYISSA